MKHLLFLFWNNSGQENPYSQSSAWPSILLIMFIYGCSLFAFELWNARRLNARQCNTSLVKPSSWRKLSIDKCYKNYQMQYISPWCHSVKMLQNLAMLPCGSLLMQNLKPNHLDFSGTWLQLNVQHGLKGKSNWLEIMIRRFLLHNLDSFSIKLWASALDYQLTPVWPFSRAPGKRNWNAPLTAGTLMVGLLQSQCSWSLWMPSIATICVK